MSTVVDDPIVDPPEVSDEEILSRCREIEVRRRADLAEHILLLRELEKRKLYYGDGHRDLAGYGRAEFRWADRDAKAHRDLERLSRTCPQVLDGLTIGRVGSAQVFLLARLARAPRVGIYVAEQIDDFLDHAAKLSFLAFEQYVIAWKCLMDQSTSLTATHCTHDGCIVAASRCQVDHLQPNSQGGATCVCNGALACGHHNRWRYLAKVKVRRLADGIIATFRPDGTRIAPPV